MRTDPSQLHIIRCTYQYLPLFQVGGKSAKSVVVAIEAHLEKAVEFVRTECKENVPTSNNQLTAALLNLFEGQLRAEEDPKVNNSSFIFMLIFSSYFFPISFLFLSSHLFLKSSLLLSFTQRHETNYPNLTPFSHFPSPSSQTHHIISHLTSHHIASYLNLTTRRPWPKIPKS